MTTIAWDTKSLAADRQTNYGSTPMPSTKIQKIMWNGKPTLIGGAGIVIDVDTTIDWLVNGGDPPKLNEDPEFSIILCNADGCFYMVNSYFIHSIGNNKWAIGSGSDYALGAMYAGKNAKGAVEIACQLDINSGLGVDVLTLGKR